MIQSNNQGRSARNMFCGAAVLLTAVFVSGCTIVGTGVQTRPNYGTTTPTGIEGSWRSTENAYTASFINNSTQWNAVDTGALLISGTYVQTTTTDYTLQLTSQVTGQTRSANCRLANVNQLNCTRDDGDQFSMIRTFGTV